MVVNEQYFKNRQNMQHYQKKNIINLVHYIAITRKTQGL